MINDDFYVYTLAYPDGTVFYVGKGKNDRINCHEREARLGKQSYKCNIIRKIWVEGGKVLKFKVHENLTEEKAFELECFLIQGYGRENLANRTNGGDGMPAFSERKPSLVPLSLSKWNGLQDLASRYLLSQGIEPTDDNLRTLARDWFYQNFAEWLKRQIEMQDGAIII